MDQEDINNYKLKLMTEQAGAFRILVEALKEILTEANFVFDETGIKLMAMDSTHTILIHMKLECDNFEFYHCPNKKIHQQIIQPVDEPFNFSFNSFSTLSYDFAKCTLSGSALKL